MVGIGHPAAHLYMRPLYLNFQQFFENPPRQTWPGFTESTPFGKFWHHWVLMDKIYPAWFSDDYFESFLFHREEKTTRTNCGKCSLKLYPASYIFRSLAHAILPKMFRFRVNDLELRSVKMSSIVQKGSKTYTLYYCYLPNINGERGLYNNKEK